MRSSSQLRSRKFWGILLRVAHTRGLYMQNLLRNAFIAVAIILSLAVVALAAGRKELHFNVAPGANISIDTRYGSITVKPGAERQASVIAMPQSDKVQIESHQNGKRISVESHL